MRSDSLELEDTLELAELEEVMISIQRNIQAARLRQGMHPRILCPIIVRSNVRLIAILQALQKPWLYLG